MSELQHEPELSQMFSGQFGGQYDAPASTLARETAAAFQVGADPSTLPAEEQRLYREKLAAIEHARASVTGRAEPLVDEFMRLYQAAAPGLTLRGTSREDAGGKRLTALERQFFASYGMLQRRPIHSLTPDVLRGVEASLDKLYFQAQVSSAYFYLFNKEILQVALNEEIIDKVSSLLGDDITLVATSGPFYAAPERRPTDWHFATGGYFGAGKTDNKLDIVSVWIPMQDTSVENGCMKMIPGSFRFANAFLAMMATHDLMPDPNGVVDSGLFERAAAAGFGPIEWISNIVSRRLNAPHMPNELMIRGRYHPFQVVVDQSAVIPAACFDLLRLGCMSMPARVGECHMFTSRNYHAAHPNKSAHVRKAFTLRYVVTGDTAGNNIADGGNAYLQQAFNTVCAAGGAAYCDRIGFTLERFKNAAPRICVRGRTPEAIREYYLDKNLLLDELSKGSWPV
jgi:ectoine hydroxylase-related dioxygenase (phytanoyl-CoA dioxygenase family)